MNHSELSEQYSALENSVSELDESNAEQTVEQRMQSLTSRFLMLGMFSVLLISVAMSFLAYTYLQYVELGRVSGVIHEQVRVAARIVSSEQGLDKQTAYDAMASVTRKRIDSMTGIKLFNAQGSLVVRSGSYVDIPNSIKVDSLNVLEPYRILSPSAVSLKMLASVIMGNYPPLFVASLVPLQNKRAIVISSIDNSEGFARHRVFVMLILFGLLLSTSFVFTLLYPTFLRSINTIDEQEELLNQQISRLSNLLKINKSMQKSIRSASARAVELNEQFLRRTGADLHDGPAQMIGFSVMRLNQAIQKDESNLISPEFHAIKQALEESLEEIRGISSGLVLPQLETLTLEQCMNKVVLLHTSAHKTEVEELYQDVDHEIPLPIKICAYRLVQEGLNNAHRHGKADECRLTVSVKRNVLRLVLKDNGVGFRKSKLSNDGKHLGLMGLKDRIESLGGKLSVTSELGIGTSLKLVINLDQDV